MEATLTKSTYREEFTPVSARPRRELPTRIIAGAAKYAQLVEGTEKIIPHEEVFRELYRKMGWKYEE